jgi:hypothetical protein
VARNASRVPAYVAGDVRQLSTEPVQPTSQGPGIGASSSPDCRLSEGHVRPVAIAGRAGKP